MPALRFYAIKFLPFLFRSYLFLKNMKQKFIACGLSIMLLLAQNAFVFSRNADVKQTSNDDVIGLFDDPDTIAVIQIKKILSETAPMLLGAHPETIEKIKAAMKDVENDLGVDPYSLDKVYFGTNLGKTSDSLLIVLKTSGSANETVEKMFQAQIVKSKFAAEINPLKNRVDSFERTINPIKNNVIPQSRASEEQDALAIETFQTELEKLKVPKAEQVACNKLKTDAAVLKKLFDEYKILHKSVYDLGDIPERFEAVKKQINAISGSDPQRTAKIAAADKVLAPIEKEFAEKRTRMVSTDEMKVFANFSMDNFPRIGEPIFEESKPEIFELQAAITERIENLKTVNESMSEKKIEPSARLKQMDAKDTFVMFPSSETATRKDETVGGKKLVAITTVKKFPERSVATTSSATNNVLVFDDQTLIIGERNALIKATEPKTAGNNQLAKNMIARSPDALVSFGINFRNMDMSELTKVIGEQKNAWQIVGSFDSGGSDVSLTAAFERSDAPINVPPKKSQESMMPKTPEIPGGDEIKDLVESMFKTIIGVEAKITVRFDKQKTASFAEQTPKFLSRILKR